MKVLFFLALSGIIFQSTSARAQLFKPCETRLPTDNADRLYTSGYGNYEDGVFVGVKFIYDGCKIISDSMFISEQKNKLYSVDTPIDGNLALTSIESFGNSYKKVVRGVTPKNNCSTPFIDQLRSAALTKLSHMQHRVQLSPSDLPLCSEVTLNSGDGFILFRGYWTTPTGYVDALNTRIRFNKVTGEILDQVNSASGM